jgi:replicative DNA helicase
MAFSPEQVDEELEKLHLQMAETDRLIAYDGNDRVVDSVEFFKEIQKKKQQQNVCLKVGLPSLDKSTNGFLAGDLVVIAGPPGHGKTTLLQTFSSGIYHSDGTKVLWFPYENTQEDFLEKYPDFDQTSPVFYIPLEMTSGRLEWMKEKIKEAQAKFNIQAVFIDHLHYLLDYGDSKRHGDNLATILGSIMRELKLTAKQLRVVIFLAAHVRKTNEKELTQADLRDSFMVAAEADFVLLIWQGDVGSKEVTLKIDKNRRTGIRGKFPLRYENKKLYEVVKEGVYD